MTMNKAKNGNRLILIITVLLGITQAEISLADSGSYLTSMESLADRLLADDVSRFRFELIENFDDTDGKFVGFISWNLCIQNLLDGAVNDKWMLLEIE